MLNVLNVFNWYLLFLLKTEPVVVEPELNTLIEKSYEPIKKVKKDTYNLMRTSYKVFEKFNPTRGLAWKNLKVMDRYNCPEIIALKRETAEEFDLELGSRVSFIMPGGKIVKKIFGDYMSSAGRWAHVNYRRVDFLINEDEKFISHPVKMIVERN